MNNQTLEKGLKNKELKKWVVWAKRENDITVKDLISVLSDNGYKVSKPTLERWTKGIISKVIDKFVLLKDNTDEEISMFLNKDKSTIWRWRVKYDTHKLSEDEVFRVKEDFKLFMSKEYYDSKSKIRDCGTISGKDFWGTRKSNRVDTAKTIARKVFSGEDSYFGEKPPIGFFTTRLWAINYNSKFDQTQEVLNMMALKAIYNGVDDFEIIYYNTRGIDKLSSSCKKELEKQIKDGVAII